MIARCPNCGKKMDLIDRRDGETSRLIQACSCGFESAANHLKIDSIYAWISVDPEDGNEGVIGAKGADNVFMPLVGADAQRMKSYELYAEHVARMSHINVKLVKFSLREELKTIKGVHDE